MKIKITKFLFLFSLSISSTVFADGDPEDVYADHTDYFNTSTLTSNQPLDAVNLLPLKSKEKNELLVLFKKDGLDKKGYQFNPNNTMYKGNFRNDGSTLIEVVRPSAYSFEPDDVDFFELKNNHLYETKFAGLKAELLDKADKSCEEPPCTTEMFYPSGAYLKNGKTYLRFSPLIGRWDEYLIENIRVDSYLWENNKLTKIEPSFSGTQFSAQAIACGAELAPTNKKFKALYAKKQYSEASATLNAYLTKCQFAISDANKIAWMQNDLLISLVNLKDKKLCVVTANQLQNNLDNEHSLIYTPSAKLKAASEFNIKKCRQL